MKNLIKLERNEKGTCVECGKPLEQKDWRFWRKYCGATCKTKAYWSRRLKQNEPLALKEAQKALEKK